ncbi:hypothetical protein EJ06DRAFT_524269 [Trichodelitschia bisporula]|uniref:Uncharacterized protein n=1 Tax=Trichodelitschia bisporula TaxID=703511 RepID=A0A6G1HN26_9PEZI|nr:hypothetical protein EJ06DRAFT_524269 [Trichodelitschia bisporula]
MKFPVFRSSPSKDAVPTTIRVVTPEPPLASPTRSNPDLPQLSAHQRLSPITSPDFLNTSGGFPFTSSASMRHSQTPSPRLDASPRVETSPKPSRSQHSLTSLSSFLPGRRTAPPRVPECWGPQHDRVVCMLEIAGVPLGAMIYRLKKEFPELRGSALTEETVDTRLQILDRTVECDYFKEGLLVLDVRLKLPKGDVALKTARSWAELGRERFAAGESAAGRIGSPGPVVME